jgi:hypothetical protein
MIAIAECCFSSYRRDAIGCELSIRSSYAQEGELSSSAPKARLSSAALLFAETPSRIILSAVDDNVAQIVQIAQEKQRAYNGNRSDARRTDQGGCERRARDRSADYRS